MSPSGDSASSPDEKISIHSDRVEKGQHDPNGKTSDPTAHVLDINELGAEGQGLQTAQDGKTVLIPQPSSDPNDPLNWNPLRKWVTLLVITVTAFLPDFGSSMGIVTLLPQAVYVALRESTREKLADEIQSVGEVPEHHSA